MTHPWKSRGDKRTVWFYYNPIDRIIAYLSDMRELVRSEYYIVKNPLLGLPLVQLRDLEWCKVHCYSSGEGLDKLPNA